MIRRMMRILTFLSLALRLGLLEDSGILAFGPED